ncbi:MAG: hypothetical protein U0893_05545 [Chloroflexota bacterium]
MTDLTAPADPLTLLDAIVRAYADADGRHADSLFMQALDADLPWTEVCSAAAQGLSRRYAPTEDRHA